MERIRAKFAVNALFKDEFGNVNIRLHAVYKGDESSPENESFSNATPSGSIELTVTNPTAAEFFDKLRGKYVYVDFTEATAN